MKQILPLLLLLVSTPALTAGAAPDCHNAMSTMEINLCAELEREAAMGEMTHYLQAVLDEHEADAELVKAIQDAQVSWEGYRQAQCGAVFTQWRGGTVRGLMTLSCQTRLTQSRTHTLWENFLTTMEGTSLLPEPMARQ